MIAWREEWRGLTRWVMAWGTYLPVRLWCIGQTLLLPMVAANIIPASAFMPPGTAWEDRPAFLPWLGLLVVGVLFWLIVLPVGRRFWNRRPVRGWTAWSWCSALPVAGTVIAHGPALNWFLQSLPTFWPSYGVWIVTCGLFWPVVLRQYPLGGLISRKVGVADED